MNEVVTIVEAAVDESKWQALEATFDKETGVIPVSIKQTQLMQSQKDPKRWRIVTQWRSQEDLGRMRATTQIPLALKIFNSVYASPNLDVWNVKVHRTARG